MNENHQKLRSYLKTNNELRHKLTLLQPKILEECHVLAKQVQDFLFKAMSASTTRDFDYKFGGRYLFDRLKYGDPFQFPIIQFTRYVSGAGNIKISVDVDRLDDPGHLEETVRLVKKEIASSEIRRLKAAKDHWKNQQIHAQFRIQEMDLKIAELTGDVVP